MTKLEAYNDSVQFLGVTRKNGVGDSELYTQKPLSAADAFNCSRGLAAYRVNQEGVLELVGEFVPRIDYSNGCPEILIENEGENFFLQSEDLSNATWVKTDSTITSNAVNAPNNELTADKIVENTSTGLHYIQQSFSHTNGVTYAISFFVKSGERSSLCVQTNSGFNAQLASGQFVNTTTGVASNSLAGVTVTSKSFLDGWFRITIFCTAASTGTSNIFLLLAQGSTISYTGDGTSGLYYWGQQGEISISGRATSYIPTTTVAVTRPADVIENNAIDYTQDEATIFVRARLEFSTDIKGVLSLYDGSVFDDYISIYIQDISGTKTLTLTTYTNPDQNDVSIAMPDEQNAIYSIAVAYNLTTSDYSLAINGAIAQTGTFANPVPTSTALTTMALGRIASNYDARIVGMMFFDTKLGDTSLENLTTQ